MKRLNKGFTLSELLIVVAIIAVLVAIAIPVFTTQLEKSREATDLANVRSAYAEVMAAAISEDETAKYNGTPIFQSDGENIGTYLAEVDLKQKIEGWTTDTQKLVVGGVSYSDEVHWLNEPAPNGSCKVYLKAGKVFLDWGGETRQNNSQSNVYKHIDKDVWAILDSSLQPFLDKYKADNKKEYSWSFLRSGDPKVNDFLTLLKENNIELPALDEAKTWTLYSSKDVATNTSKATAFYWSTIDAEETYKTYKKDSEKFDQSGNSKFTVPVIGFDGTSYDVYATTLQHCNAGNWDEYTSITKINNNKATYEFATLEEAQAAYNVLLAEYEDKGTVADWRTSLINAGYKVD